MGALHQVNNGADYTLPIGKANVLGILIVVPITVIYVFSYEWIWGWEKMAGDIAFLSGQYAMVLAGLTIGVLLHELLHAIVWAALGGLSPGDFRFGFNVRGLSPYAHSRSPMPVSAYRWGTATPGILLGVIPFCLALTTGNAYLMSFGFIFTLVAAGDFLMLWIIRDIRSGLFVQDHPDRVGCNIVSNGNHWIPH